MQRAGNSQMRSSEPEGAGLAQERHELAAEVQRHDLVGGADELAADEDRRPVADVGCGIRGG